MKFLAILMAMVGIPALALAQAPNTASPTAVPPSPTPTMDMSKAPKIFCAKPNWDFGMVDEGPDITHDFIIRNIGKGPMKITGVSTSCGCTAAFLKKAGTKKDEAAAMPVTLRPGGRGTIKVTFHTQGRPGHPAKDITVASDDPVNPNYRLHIDMYVVREVDVQPSYLSFSDHKQGVAAPVTVKVLGKPGKNLKVLSAIPANGIVTITGLAPYRDIDQNLSGYSFLVDVPLNQPIGNFSDKVLIKTDDPKKPEVEAQVTGEVVGPVRYSSQTMTFSPPYEMPTTIAFTSENPQQFAIRDVWSVKHLVRPSILKTTQDGVDKYFLVVHPVKKVPKDSDGKDQVIVITNDEKMTKITLDAQVNK